MLRAVASNPLGIWSRLQALVWGAALVWLALFSAPAGGRFYVAAGACASIATLACVLRVPATPADAVTLLRALLLAMATCAPDWPGLDAFSTWILFAVAAMLDLVDGAVARRFGASDRGAVLDMEADQLSVLCLSCSVVLGGGAPHVLLLPLMRYAFVLAAWCAALPANDPKPVDGDNHRGRLVCAVVVVALLLALLPGTPRWTADVLTGSAVLLLTWSFAGDWAFLFARRGREARS
jgi:phosphatidylglycerophosphate synthase